MKKNGLPLDQYISQQNDRRRLTLRFHPTLVVAAVKAAEEMGQRKNKKVSLNEFVEAAVQMAIDLQSKPPRD